jgi:tripartite-type tricarboxylate transporter receptor subunit TctC
MNWLRLLLLLIAVTCSAPVLAQTSDYPNQLIHIIVPYPAGGMPDRIARDVAQGLQTRLKQTVIVENKPGASGNIGFDYALRQPANGYTLLLSPASNLTTQKALFNSVPYDPQRDFEPVSILAQAPQVLLVNPDVPARSLAELIDFAKKNPGKLNFGATLGAFSHLAGELMGTQAGIQFAVIPYQGSNVAVQGLLGGSVDMMFYDVVGAMPLVKAGKVRVLGVAYRDRLKSLPDVPTMSEAGLKGFEAISWYALITRSGTPAPIVSRLATELSAIMTDPVLRKGYEDVGAIPVGSTPKEAAAWIDSETRKWTAVVDKAGIRPN